MLSPWLSSTPAVAETRSPSGRQKSFELMVGTQQVGIQTLSLWLRCSVIIFSFFFFFFFFLKPLKSLYASVS